MVRQCAPTLAGLKTASLFPCPNEAGLQQDVCRWNAVLNPKGVQVTVLCCKEDRALVYVYRPERLEADMRRTEARGLLQGCGYCGSLSCCMRQLAQKLQQKEGFPHEIGLFLGYPPADVKGFMEQKGKNCKCSGYWKVYDDAQEAQRQFARFEKCTHVYLRLFDAGFSMEKLTVGKRVS